MSCLRSRYFPLFKSSDIHAESVIPRILIDLYQAASLKPAKLAARHHIYVFVGSMI
jgi:hypothetical protein